MRAVEPRSDRPLARACRRRAQPRPCARGRGAPVRRRGGREVTMEQIATAAGVGKATLYRRYPDVPSIALALLDEHERALQERLLRGPPPLGPGAPPADRLAAFYRAMVDLLERHGHLALAAETGEHRYRTGAYRTWAMHVGVPAHRCRPGRPPGARGRAAGAAGARRVRASARKRPFLEADRRRPRDPRAQNARALTPVVRARPVGISDRDRRVVSRRARSAARAGRRRGGPLRGAPEARRDPWA